MPGIYREVAVRLFPALLLLLIILGFIQGCEAADRPRIEDMEARGARAFIREHGGGPDFVILDIRTPGEFAAGHIEGAVNIDYYSESFEDDIAGLDREATYIVYCRTGRRSGKAMEFFRELGFRRVLNLAGGLRQWKEEGFPVLGNKAAGTG